MKNGHGMVPPYYDHALYGGHDPGYEADLEEFVRENKVIMAGDPEQLGAAEHKYETALPRQPLPRVLEPEESAESAPGPTRLPDGAPHPNPLLAELGWQAQGGWYVRQREADREPGA